MPLTCYTIAVIGDGRRERWVDVYAFIMSQFENAPDGTASGDDWVVWAAKFDPWFAEQPLAVKLTVQDRLFVPRAIMDTSLVKPVCPVRMLDFVTDRQRSGETNERPYDTTAHNTIRMFAEVFDRAVQHLPDPVVWLFGQPDEIDIEDIRRGYLRTVSQLIQVAPPTLRRVIGQAIAVTRPFYFARSLTTEYLAHPECPIPETLLILDRLRTADYTAMFTTRTLVVSENIDTIMRNDGFPDWFKAECVLSEPVTGAVVQS